MKKSDINIVLRFDGDPAKRFRQALRKLGQFDGFLGWSESNTFARTLTEVIATLADSKVNPREGMELLIDFYRTDGTVLNSCDDSDGTVGDVYRID